MSNTSPFSFQSLAQIRKRLLDLSSRNALLNYRFPKGKSVEIFNISPNMIQTKLFAGEKLALDTIDFPNEKQLKAYGHTDNTPFPSASDWAKYLDIQWDNELPNNDSKNNALTVMYPHHLSAIIKKINQENTLTLNETGSHILYLCLGFLAWQDGNQKRLAPLLTLPVNLESSTNRGKQTHYLVLKEDDGFINMTLSEKLKADFDFRLPEWTENSTPESYFQAVQKLIEYTEPKLSIQRRACIALLNFSKQAMYDDLNPDTWQDCGGLDNHPILQELFNPQSIEHENNSMQNEYHIDEYNQEIHQTYPLIYDADSSQHSALIDAIAGKNLVIEGPPGTGKSQTITNLIAAFINNGKKVLFVAEKMAALNVVKDRLDKAGLGNFCLELHSNKTNKQKILSDLITQSQQTYPNHRADLQAEINGYEQYKNDLNQYVQQINSEYKNTQISIHHILNRVTRLSEEFKSLNILPEQVAFSVSNNTNWDNVARTQMHDKGKMFKTVYQKVAEQSPNGNIVGHYWHGVQKHTLTSSEQTALISSLTQWNESLQQLLQFKQDWQTHFQTALTADDEQSLQTLLKTAEQLPQRQGDELFLAEWFDENTLFRLKQSIEIYQNYFNELKEIEPIFQKDTLNNPHHFSQIDEIIQNLNKVSLSNENRFVDYAKHYKNLNDLNQNIATLAQQIEKIQPQLPNEFIPLFSLKIQNLKEWEILVDLMTQLPKELWQHRANYLDNDGLDKLLSELTPVLNNAKQLHKNIHNVFKLNQLPDSDDLENYLAILENGGLFRFLSSDWRMAKNEVLALSKQKTAKINELQEALPELIRYQELLEKANAIHQKNPLLGQVYQGINTPIENIAKLRDWYQKVRQEYGVAFGERTHIGTALLSLDEKLAFAIVALYREQLKPIATQIETELDELKLVFEPIHKLCAENLHLQNDNIIANLLQALRECLTQLNSHLVNKEIPLTQMESANQILSGLNQTKAQWLDNTKHCEWRQHWQFSFKVDEYAQNQVQAALNTLKLFSTIQHNQDLIQALKQQNTAQNYDVIVEKLNTLQTLLHNQSHHQTAFMLQGQVDKSLWLADVHFSLSRIDEIIQKNQQAIEHADWLYNWTQYLSAKHSLSQGHLDNIIQLLESKNLPADKIENAIELAIFHQLQQQIFAENELIREFNSSLHQAKIERFKNYDKNLMVLQRKQIAHQTKQSAPMGIGTGSVGNFSELSLIRHEHGKRSRHIPIRQLFTRSAKAIQALKPCLMMSPMSVAQYLQAGCFEFDVVIMDEASQILPEFAIGALARIKRDGGSVVIVGDPKQLPPTNFFSTNNNNDDENDEVLAIEASESILDTVSKHPKFHQRRLRWHYRSRHESLIAFSNRQFYDSDLVLFPSPMQESDDLGIRFHRIEGVYGDSINVIEATEIVKQAIDILQNSPSESIGLVAMNSKQRDEIERQFAEQLEQNPALQALYDEKAKTDPVFIKNLENVQGDERDVILISMTYGPETIGGRVYQRFGPINSSGGWRRLNVLFTRAKKRMHIFSSMGSNDVLISNESSKGVQALQAFLHYCETGRLGTQGILTGKAPDSDFEIAVIRALEQHGYQCEPQVGVNGFFIDIAVRNPKLGSQGQFLLGIECDGATYHSSKSARDRDRLRQEILENLGWEIQRIWSTDWFRNPQAALQPILNRLNALTAQ